MHVARRRPRYHAYDTSPLRLRLKAMDSLKPGVIANREEPIPELKFGQAAEVRGNAGDESSKESSPARKLKKKLSESKLKKSLDEKAGHATEGSSLQDKMFAT